MARIRERIVQPPDQLGGLDVRRVLIPESPALHPEDEAEHAEYDPHEEAFQIVPPVARIRERIVQPPDQLGGLDVRRVLIPESPALHPEDEAERLDMLGQVRERERDGLPLVEVVKLEVLEIAHQNKARTITLRQRVEILSGLFEGRFQIATGALLFDEQYTRPEQVDEARAVVQLRDMRFVTCDAPPLNSEHPEEGVVEALSLARRAVELTPRVWKTLFPSRRLRPPNPWRTLRPECGPRSTTGASADTARRTSPDGLLALGRKRRVRTIVGGRDDRPSRSTSAGRNHACIAPARISVAARSRRACAS